VINSNGRRSFIRYSRCRHHLADVSLFGGTQTIVVAARGGNHGLRPRAETDLRVLQLICPVVCREGG
jgi:hypothetical protein